MNEEDQPKDKSAEAPASGPEIQTPEVVRGVPTAKPATEEHLAQIERQDHG
jgi:hypothetical protein